MKIEKCTFFFICILFLSILPSAVFAQCEISTAQIDLEGDNSSVRLHASGDLWWDGISGKYLFPKPPQGIPDVGVSAIKVGGLWLGGFDQGGELKIAAQTNGRTQGLTDYWPGPNGDQEDCSNYDRFWTMTDVHINAHIADYEDNGVIDGPVHPSILAWPGTGNPHSMEYNGFEISGPAFGNRNAPFEDTNSDAIYDPMDGDYPDIKCASDAVWWSFNDFGGIHTQSGGAPLQVRASMLAFTYESTIENIENSTFYHLEFTNKSNEVLDSAYLGLWIDFDLGCPFDDFIGCDTLNNLAYVYNEDSVDGIANCSDCAGFNTYCEEVPMVGLKVLRKPIGAKMFINGLDSSDGLRNPSIGETADTIIELDMNSFIYYNQGANSPFPAVPAPSNGSPEQFYNLLSGSWADGTPITRGGSGYNPGSTDYTRYVFPGNPNDSEGWSMCSENFSGSDRKVLMGFGPFSMIPDGSNSIVFAVVGIENVAHPCPDVTPLIEAANEVQNYAGNGYNSFDGCSFFTSNSEVPNSKSNEVVFQPNPMHDQSQIILKDQRRQINEVAFYSVAGKQILLVENIDASSLEINRGSLSPGIYFYVLKTDDSNLYSGKFIVQ